MSSPAEQLFQAWLDAQGAGEEADPASFCAEAAPEVQQGFQALVADYRGLVQMLRNGPRLKEGATFSRFVLKRQLGRGASGVVWEAEELSLRRPVALKILHPLLALSEHSRQRFQREAEAAARFEHQGIARIFGTGETDGFHWIAQELVGDGETLWDWIEQERRGLRQSDFRELARKFQRLAEALSAAHEAGILHRDIKPGNILIDASEDWKLADFGLARLNNAVSLTLGFEEAGTPAYMAPEQILGGVSAADERSEVFSFGATIYETVGLARAFEASTREQAAQRILHDRPARLSQVRSGIPPELELVIQKSLEREPERRYRSMRDLAGDLARFARGEPVLATAPTIRRRATAWVRRNPWRAGMLAGGAAAFVAMGLLWQKAERSISVTEGLSRKACGLIDLVDPYRAASQRTDSVPKLVELGNYALIQFQAIPAARYQVLFTAGRGLRWAEHFEVAMEFQLDALRLSRDVWGPTSPQALETQLEVAWCMAQMDRHEEAIPLLQEVMEAAPADRLDLRATALNRLGQAWWEVADDRKGAGEERPEDAIRRIRGYWTECARILDGADGKWPALQALNDLNLGSYWATWGWPDPNAAEEAKRHLERAQRGFEEDIQPMHPEVIRVYLAMGDLRGQEGDVDGLIEYRRKAWTTSTLLLGRNHKTTLEVREVYVLGLKERGPAEEARSERAAPEADKALEALGD